jgi:D-beta-D-heptose 7-phosphate kinase/D-beta-D-heptose 1-phosphate adenosyltransferase
MMEKIVAISGGFDPIHSGHTALIEDALKLGDSLYIFLNSDDWLVRKKGFYLLPFKERASLLYLVSKGLAAISSNKPVSVLAVTDTDNTVCETLKLYKPTIFANGGDRKDPQSIPEYKTCIDNNIEVVFGVGGFDKKGASTSYFLNAVEMYLSNNNVEGVLGPRAEALKILSKM